MKTKKEIEISHLWERVNTNEYRVKSLTDENGELWKRVNLAEENLLTKRIELLNYGRGLIQLNLISKNPMI
ncbi:hypothetical protein [Paenibacillus sp. Marseille-Q7038]